MTPRLPVAATLPDAATANLRVASRRSGSAESSGPTLQLHIGRVTLQGLHRAEGQRVAAAFEHELRRLAATVPWPTQALGLPKAHLPPLLRAAGERPETTGRRLAQRIAAQWGPR